MPFTRITHDPAVMGGRSWQALLSEGRHHTGLQPRTQQGTLGSIAPFHQLDTEPQLLQADHGKEEGARIHLFSPLGHARLARPVFTLLSSDTTLVSSRSIADQILS
jgi:hypothetical protein